VLFLIQAAHDSGVFHSRRSKNAGVDRFHIMIHHDKENPLHAQLQVNPRPGIATNGIGNPC
jgi:hypothetical protein